MSNGPQNMHRLSLDEIAKRLKPVELPPLCENPLVSIITANYNYAQFIGEAIESAQNQTYSNWEMIVCDDGSTDNSCEVVETYMRSDRRIRLITKENGGQSSAANAAYRECRGQIICFLDADDRFLPEKLKTVVQAFLSHPDRGFAGDRTIRIDEFGRRNSVVPSTADPLSGWYGPYVVRYGHSPYGLAFGPLISLRREISDLIFPIPNRFTTGPDSAIMALAPLMTPIIGIPTPLTEYRYHGKNHSGVNSRRFNPDTLARGRHIYSIMREASREYLKRVNPILAEALPSFDERQATLLNAYMQVRLKTWGGALSAYRDLLRAESFATLNPAAKWFWRLSIILPRPVFRFALGPNRLRQLFWRAVEVRRRHFAS